MTNEQKELESRVREALADRNLSVVAERLDMSPHTLYRLVNGDMKRGTNMSTLKAIARYLKINDGDEK